MIEINLNVFDRIKEEFPDSFHDPYEHCYWIPTGYRYIRIYTPIKDDNIYYFVGNWSIDFQFPLYNIEKYNDLLEYLINETQDMPGIEWDENDCKFHFAAQPTTEQQTFDSLHFFIDTFNQLIHAFETHTEDTKTRCLETIDPYIEAKGKVELHEMSLCNVLQLPLRIPVYQRVYCWEEENVKQLLDDIFEFFSNDTQGNAKYRLGTIILHRNEKRYDIIDGQQRLVTLAITLSCLCIKCGLLNEKFVASKSIDYLRYNKYLIDLYIKRNAKRNKKFYADNFLERVDFSVLILQNTSLDLAYTFFSTANSRGVALTDYDLLKAHHLRYIPTSFSLQSKRAARVWNKMIENGRKQKEADRRADYEELLDTYLYRLRRWVRRESGMSSDADHHIKKEFEAAPIISELPPFGEHFDFYEPIQGGTHFFAFTERYMRCYSQFIATEEVKALRRHIYGGTNLWYRDVIEALLFGYYQKFGGICMADALMVIMRIVLQHRYDSKRAEESSILEFVTGKEIIIAIQQATSPTFFLAEEWNIIKEMSYPPLKNMGPTRRNMKKASHLISKDLAERIVVSQFKNINS